MSESSRDVNPRLVRSLGQEMVFGQSTNIVIGRIVADAPDAGDIATAGTGTGVPRNQRWRWAVEQPFTKRQAAGQTYDPGEAERDVSAIANLFLRLAEAGE